MSRTYYSKTIVDCDEDYIFVQEVLRSIHIRVSGSREPASAMYPKQDIKWCRPAVRQLAKWNHLYHSLLYSFKYSVKLCSNTGSEQPVCEEDHPGRSNKLNLL